MSQQGLAEGQRCPVCSLGGVLALEMTSEADLIDGRTVVVHGVPTLVCNRCGAELFDEITTRTLEAFYEHAANDKARAFIVDFPAAAEALLDGRGADVDLAITRLHAAETSRG